MLALAGCSNSVTGPEAALTAAKQRWAHHAPASYSMVIARSCECVPQASQAVVLTVRNGIVESRRYVATGASVDPQYAADFPTVPEMFALIQNAANNRIRPMNIQYAPLGYPTLISIGDPAVDAPVIFISDFHAL